MTFSLVLLMSACNEDVDPNVSNKVKEDPYLKYESATDFWFSYKAGDTVLAVVDVNRAYSATIAEGGEWCKTSELDIHSFKISYEENRKSEDRKTKITLSMEGVDDIVINVAQRGPDLVLRADSAKYLETVDDDGAKSIALSLPYKGGDIVAPITTNGDYQVEVEAGNSWCSVTNKTETGIELNIPQNPDYENSRSAKVTVSLTYRDSTARFEFFVSQPPTPALWPGEGEVIEKTDGFPYEFTWRKNPAVPNYSLVISTNNSFPEEATKVIDVGNVDRYSMPLSDLADLIANSGHFNTPFYWTVRPTDPNIDITVATAMFRVLRKLKASYPMRINPYDGSWQGYSEEDGYDVFHVNMGQSSRRTYISTFATTEAIEGKIFAVAYEYKTSNRNPAYEYDEFHIYHFAGAYDGNWTRDSEEITCPFTDEWLPLAAPITLSRGWGEVGSKVTFFIRPMVVTSNNNNIGGMHYHFKDLRVEEYEE